MRRADIKTRIPFVHPPATDEQRDQNTVKMWRLNRRSFAASMIIGLVCCIALIGYYATLRLSRRLIWPSSQMMHSGSNNIERRQSR
jgi:hypothetical protein